MRPEAAGEGLRWIRQAERDLDDAEYNRAGHRYSLVCFLCQQAAEKALKAALLSRGDEVWGHSVYKLGSSLRAPNDLLDLARVLDTYYIPTRYAIGIDEGAPSRRLDRPSRSSPGGR